MPRPTCVLKRHCLTENHCPHVKAPPVAPKPNPVTKVMSTSQTAGEYLTIIIIIICCFSVLRHSTCSTVHSHPSHSPQPHQY